MKLNKLCAALVSGALLTGTVLPAGGAMGSSVTAAQEPEPLNGRLITNLTVLDQANAADWSICYDYGEGSAIYGDRDITAAFLPVSLAETEMIRTACDSKMYRGDLASFTAGGDITVYAAVDARVNEKLDWLKAWTRSGVAVSTSNGVKLELFTLDARAGEQVVLGTNGGEMESANYIVFAVPRENLIKGDLNMDGRVDALDLVLARRALAGGFAEPQAFRAADVDENEGVEAVDLRQLQDFLIEKRKQFHRNAPEKSLPKQNAEPETPENTDSFPYSDALQYKAAPASYRQDCPQQGTVERLSYQTTVYSSNLTKSAYVYLPYGYDSSKQYDIMYMMHGGGGNESSIFLESSVMKKYLDHMIMNGDIEPMIVVTPTFNNAAGSDMTTNSKNFWNELEKDLLPAVEGKYSTYAVSTSAADLKASRSHRAFSGFSLGALTAWYVFLNSLDYFQYIMPLSGDCWAGNTAQEKATVVADAARQSGYSRDEYFLMCATGTKDIAYAAMRDQIEVMKTMTDVFTYTSDFSKGNFYFLTCEGGTHYWDGYIVDYIYDGLPYLFHEN